MTLVQDVQVACRGLRRSPGFSIVAVVTLAVGIGINVAVFTVANASLFKGFRLVAGNDRILYLGTQKNGRGCCASYPDFIDWRAQAKSFSDLGAVADLQITLSDGQDGGAEHYDATEITTNGFRMLGQQPILGRDFAPGDAQPGAAEVAILREAFWERRYGKDPAVVGRVIVSSIGGLLGWWIATWAVRAYAITANPPARLWSADLIDFAVDARVLMYLLAVSLGTAVLCALAPVPSLTRFDVGGALKSERGGGDSIDSRRWSVRLIVCEMALAVVLLAAAGVMVRSFLSMATADVGIRPASVTSMFMSLPQDRYRDAAAQIAFFDRLTAHLAAAPGIASLSIAIELPASSVRTAQYEVAGSSPVDAGRRPAAPLLVIGPRYFATLGAAVTAGRDFTDSDAASSAPVAIVNRQFATMHWPGADPIGQRVRLFDGLTPPAWLTVVGVASDIVQNTGDRTVHDPVVYRPFRQQPRRAMWVIVRSDVAGASLAATVRREVHAIDTALPIWIGPSSLNELMAAMGNYWRLGQNAALFGVFASVALGLAAIGLYAVVVSAVQRRTREIGIRIAIGATRPDVLKFVFRQGLLPAGTGLTIGLGLSLVVTPVLKTQLVRVPAIDPIALLTAAVMLLFAAALGCAVPALRAVRIDPIVALRQD